MKVSIIIPVYNSQKTIEKLLVSLKNQTYNNYEVIIVDDGSTDSSRQIVKKYEDVMRLKLICLSQNQGVSNARNVGIKYATGEYIFFMDSDDYVEPQFLEHYIGLESDYVVQKKLNDKTTSCLIVQVEEYKYRCSEFWTSIRIQNVWGVRYKTSVIRSNNLSFDTNMNWAEDTYFNIQYLNCCKEICVIPFSEYIYTINSNSLSRKFERNRYDNALKLAKKFLEFTEVSTQSWMVVYIYWEMAIKHYLNHLRDFSDFQWKKDILFELNRTIRCLFFRQCIPVVYRDGTLDMKILVLCTKNVYFVLFYPNIIKLIMKLAEIKKVCGG